MRNYFKYPGTPHLPWSEGFTGDDIRLADITHLEKLSHVIVTEKLDGENFTMYNDYAHARSIDSKYHESRNWVKRLHSQISYQIPEGVRICGENLYAKHSIYYDSLPAYFLVFSIWENDLCLSWQDTMNLCKELNLYPVPVLYEGRWEEEEIRNCLKEKSMFGKEQEGYVVRNSDSFKLDAFKTNIAKYVRKGHVQDNAKHWMQSFKIFGKKNDLSTSNFK